MHTSIYILGTKGKKKTSKCLSVIRTNKYLQSQKFSKVKIATGPLRVFVSWLISPNCLNSRWQGNQRNMGQRQFAAWSAHSIMFRQKQHGENCLQHTDQISNPKDFNHSQHEFSHTICQLCTRLSTCWGNLFPLKIDTHHTPCLIQSLYIITKVNTTYLNIAGHSAWRKFHSVSASKIIIIS